jgi:uncharacterized protein
MRKLSAEDVEALAVGAWILGTGGGGSPYHGLLNVRRLYREGVQIALIDPQALDDADRVAVVSYMGAPLVTQERLVDARLTAQSVELMQDYLGVRFRAVMAIEIGGGNAMQPLLAAAQLGIPVVDADAMGRAYPEAQMTTFAVGDLAPAPLTSIDPRGNAVIVARAASWRWMERISRKVCTEFGSIAATCKAPRTGAEVKRWGVAHTITKAIRLGTAVITAKRRRVNPIEAILAAEHGKHLFAGKVVEVDRRTTEGFLRGHVAIASGRCERFLIDFQNEWTVVWRDKAPVASTPELICLLDSDTGEAIGTEMVRYGQRVDVLVLPSPQIFLTPRGLELVGPRAFGHDIEFRSVFAA